MISKELILITILLASLSKPISCYTKSEAEITDEFNRNLQTAHQTNANDGRVQQVIDQIRQREHSSGKHVTAIHCYGIGALIEGASLSPADDHIRQAPHQLGQNNINLPSHYRQLDFCNALRLAFGIHLGHYHSSILEPIEHHLVESMGFVQDCHVDASFQIDAGHLTIVYAPRMASDLAENLLAANWSPAQLNSLIYLGRDLEQPVMEKTVAFMDHGYDERIGYSHLDLLRWEHTITNQFAHISMQGFLPQLFPAMVVFDVQTALPRFQQLVERFELRLLNRKVTRNEQNRNFVAMANTLKVGLPVGAVVVYGIGPFMAGTEQPTMEIAVNNADLVNMITFKRQLNCTGIFYMHEQLSNFQQHVLHDFGFEVLEHNGLRHEITSTRRSTLVFIHGDYSDECDDILFVNWSVQKLNALRVITEKLIDDTQYALWGHLKLMHAIETSRLGRRYLLYAINLPFNAKLPEARTQMALRFIQGGYTWQKARGGSAASGGEPEIPQEIINRGGKLDTTASSISTLSGPTPLSDDVFSCEGASSRGGSSRSRRTSQYSPFSSDPGDPSDFSNSGGTPPAPADAEEESTRF